MRKAVLAVMLVLVFLVAAFLAGVNPASGGAMVEDSWETVAPLPGSYYGVLGATVVDGKIYFVGEDVCECYDPETNNWAAIAAPPAYSAWGTIVACQNKIYVTGDPTQVYNPATGTWENKTAIPLTILGYKANVVDDKIYVISGGKPAAVGAFFTSAASYVYDPATDSWSELAPIPTPVQGYASAVLDNKIYIIGGGTSELAYIGNASDLVQIYDPKTNQWTNGTPIPTGVYGAAACSTSGHFAPKRIYVVGGNLYYSGGGTSADLNPKGTTLNQVYDLETGTWSSAASLPDSRWFLSLVNINDALYAVGGVNASYLLVSANIQATEKYIPLEYDESLLPMPSPSPTLAPDSSTANLLLITLSAVAVTSIIAGLAVYHRKLEKNS